jgi:hypothetical protein
MVQPALAANRWLRIGVTMCTPIFVLVCAPCRVSAQAGCPNDATVTFPNEVAGVVTLQDARIGDVVTGGGNADRAQQLNLAGPQTAQAQGALLRVNSISTNEFPSEAAALQLGFDRRVNRFFEVNYTNGQYQFANRADLDVQVTFSVPGDVANSVLGGSASRATITPQLDNLNVRWYGGQGNSLRQLRGRVTFRYSDLADLQQPGIHRADLSLCVEVSGFQ